MGKRQRHQSAYKRWTEDELQDAMELVIERPIGVQTRVLKRSRKSIREAVNRRYGDIRTLRAEALIRRYTFCDLWRLFGVSHVAMTRLLRAGAFGKQTRYSQRTQSHWCISTDAVRSFIHNRDYWMSWEPVNVSDPDWRWEAEEARREADGQWVSLGDLCARLGYDRKTGIRWRQSGEFRTARQWNRVWYIWSVEAAAFVPPSERGR